MENDSGLVNFSRARGATSTITYLRLSIKKDVYDRLTDDDVRP